VPVLEAVDEESESGSEWEGSEEGTQRRTKKVNGVGR